MLVFIVVQFHRELPRQCESGDETVDGSVFGDTAFGIDDLEHQPAFRLLQHLNQSLVALLYFLLGGESSGGVYKQSYRSLSSSFFMGFVSF